MSATAYQAEWICSRESHLAALMGRRLGKSWEQASSAAMRMLAMRPRLDGLGFERDPDGPTDQAITSASELQSQQLLRAVYEQVEALCRAGLVGPECYPNDPSANSFSLRSGTATARAYADNPRVIRGGSSDWIGDEVEFSRDFEALYAAASLLAAPTLKRPQRGGFKIKLTSSAWIAGTMAAQVMSGDGTEANDRFRHFRRWRVTVVDAVRLFGWPRPGMSTDEQDELLARMRAELGDRIWATEMMCQHIDGDDLWCSPEILARARYDVADYPAPHDIVATYGAADIARSPTGDLACLARGAVDRKGVLWISSPTTGRGVTFEQQSENIATLIESGVRRCAIDASGMGAPVASALSLRFPGKIESITWTAQSKSALFEGLLHGLDTLKIRIPNDVALIRDIGSYRRIARANGTFGYDATKGADGSHGDRTAAVAMLASLAQLGSGGFSVVSAGRRDVADIGRDFGIAGAGHREYDRPGISGRPLPRRGNNGFPWG